MLSRSRIEQQGKHEHHSLDEAIRGSPASDPISLALAVNAPDQVSITNIDALCSQFIIAFWTTARYATRYI